MTTDRPDPVRPCAEEHPDPLLTQGQCRACHDAVHSPFWRDWWGIEPLAKRPAPRPKPAAKPSLRALSCIHEGAVVEWCTTCGANESRHVRDCSLHERCTRGVVNPQVRACSQCADYRTEPTPALPPTPIPVPIPVRADEPAVGVAIGSYKWPELVTLQIQLIRATCGAVPILVSSDHPPSHSAIAAICAAYPDVLFSPNAQRIGHTGGDVGVFHKATLWGNLRGLSVVAKLSQRFLVTRPRWLQESARELLDSGLPLASRACRGVQTFDLRTEACLLSIPAWNNPAVLSRIAPRPYWNDSPKGLSAETVIHRVLTDLLGGIYWPWVQLYGEERYRRDYADVLWHNHTPVEEYRTLAQTYGVTLPADFHCQGWESERRKGEYAYG